MIKNKTGNGKKRFIPLSKPSIVKKGTAVIQSAGTNINITRNKAFQNEPSVAIQGKTVIVTANDYRTGNPKIGLYRSIDGGKTFSRKILAKGNGGIFYDKPWLAIKPPNVSKFRNHAYVAYTQLSDNDRKTAIFFSLLQMAE